MKLALFTMSNTYTAGPAMNFEEESRDDSPSMLSNSRDAVIAPPPGQPVIELTARTQSPKAVPEEEASDSGGWWWVAFWVLVPAILFSLLWRWWSRRPVRENASRHFGPDDWFEKGEDRSTSNEATERKDGAADSPSESSTELAAVSAQAEKGRAGVRLVIKDPEVSSVVPSVKRDRKLDTSAQRNAATPDTSAGLGVSKAKVRSGHAVAGKSEVVPNTGDGPAATKESDFTSEQTGEFGIEITRAVQEPAGLDLNADEIIANATVSAGLAESEGFGANDEFAELDPTTIARAAALFQQDTDVVITVNGETDPNADESNLALNGEDNQQSTGLLGTMQSAQRSPGGEPSDSSSPKAIALEESQQQSEALRKENEALLARTQRLRGAGRQLVRKLQELQQEPTDSQIAEDSQQTVEHLRLELQEAREAMAVSQQAAAELQQQQAALESQVTQAQAELATAREQHAEETNKAQGLLSQMEAEKSRQQASVKEIETLRRTEADLRSEVQSLTESQGHLLVERDQLVGQKDQLASAHAQYRELAETHARATEIAREDLAKAEQQLAALRKEVEGGNAEIRSELATALKEAQAAQAEADAAKKSLEIVHAELGEAQKELAETRSALAEAKTKVTDSQTKFANQKASVEMQETKLATVQAELDAARRELDNVKAQFEATQTE